jgi:pyruvate,water dikinase
MSNQQQQNSSVADAYVLPFEQLRMTDVESAVRMPH